MGQRYQRLLLPVNTIGYIYFLNQKKPLAGRVQGERGEILESSRHANRDSDYAAVIGTLDHLVGWIQRL